MKERMRHEFNQADGTKTLRVISATTDMNCIVTTREYEDSFGRAAQDIVLETGKPDGVGNDDAYSTFRSMRDDRGAKWK